MIRYGLCCIFRKAPIRFRRTTARYLGTLQRRGQLDHLAALIRHNGEALMEALRYCRANGIGAFRINSQIWPLKTHPAVGYEFKDLPGYRQLVDLYKACGEYSRRHDLRTSFHPDQFVVLSSPHENVLRQSLAELAYQAEAAELVHADVINLHGGGAYNDKQKALQRLTTQLRRLPAPVRSRLTLENDDRVYTPRNLLPVCRAADVPLVYDVHHHRCLPDGGSEAETTEKALGTWRREPLFHLSSPLSGWQGGDCRPHHDFIDPCDFPREWVGLDLTVDVEAKAKETAVLKLMTDMAAGTSLDGRCPAKEERGGSRDVAP